jgi:hypothetical protein
MAEKDDTSNVTRRRRNQPDSAAAVPVVAISDSGLPPAGDPPPPRTLEEAIENVCALLREVRGMLHCLSEVLLYSDDADGVLHAEVANAAERWISDSAEQLDIEKLRPLIEAARHRDGGTSGNDGSQGGAGDYPYQVREPTAVYHVERTSVEHLCRRAECGGRVSRRPRNEPGTNEPERIAVQRPRGGTPH